MKDVANFFQQPQAGRMRKFAIHRELFVSLTRALRIRSRAVESARLNRADGAARVRIRTKNPTQSNSAWLNTRHRVHRVDKRLDSAKRQPSILSFARCSQVISQARSCSKCPLYMFLVLGNTWARSADQYTPHSGTDLQCSAKSSHSDVNATLQRFFERKLLRLGTAGGEVHPTSRGEAYDRGVSLFPAL